LDSKGSRTSRGAVILGILLIVTGVVLYLIPATWTYFFILPRSGTTSYPYQVTGLNLMVIGLIVAAIGELVAAGGSWSRLFPEYATPKVILRRLLKRLSLQVPFILLITAIILIIGSFLSYVIDVVHLSLFDYTYDPYIGGSDFDLWRAISYGSIAMLFCSIMASTYRPQQRSSSTVMLWSKTVPAAKGEIINDYSGQQTSWILVGMYCLSTAFFPFILFAVSILGISAFVAVRVINFKKRKAKELESGP